MPLNFFNFIGFPLSYLLLLFLQAALLSNGSIVKTLPGFPGVLPFKLETGDHGWVGLQSFSLAQIETSLVVTGQVEWASSPTQESLFFTFFMKPKNLVMVMNLQTASLIFVDAPIGTGFSYATTPEGNSVSDTKSARQTHNFYQRDPSNAKCLADLEAIYECIGQIDFANILEPRCDINLVAGEKDGQQARRSLKENQTYNFISSVQKTDKNFGAGFVTPPPS
ncbi:hypothetical protein FEM48_Zijuj09G0192300 [Ziziphus jujuba var. spinosa]|uniref:Uncharacterized protein n=1 Tax=Ziziphus jujuba var. spinosa TaxID=714518 RepID=A0A978UUT8_ZIZJJ|nr:hypothetical protein FEM48_Zijuj09G0192300 [Ziziphus jujuba var. spinosa]